MSFPITSLELSSISGWMSIACWIVVYTPQIWENYQLKSGEGLSVTFVVLWLLGDLTNLAGGIMANVLTTMILLAIYYALCDFILLFQVYYYRRTPPPTSDETTHLLSASNPPTQPKPLLPPGLEYPLLLTFVLGAGIFAWFLSDSHDEIGIPEGPGRGGDVELEWKSQTLGYISATLYLGSRIPQIIHNFKTRCAGLSLAMFFFTITGNITYAVSILSVSTDPHYILVNTSWLAGALLTIVFDLFVMGQFAIYSWQDRRERETKIFAEVEEEEERV